MDVFEAIKGRRTVHEFKSDPVPRQQLEQMLEAAVWAPNHKLTNPWEFYVFSGAAKEKLARLRGQLKLTKYDDPAGEKAQKSYQRAYGELATVPCAILVCQVLADEDKRREEDLLAVACAIQNLMLAAHGMGIGTYWGTGPLVNHPETFRTLGVPDGRRGVGIVFVGYPAGENKAPTRVPSAEKTRWIE